MYEEIRQETSLNSFYTKNSIGLTKGWKQFSLNPKFGIQFENQHLKSEIISSENQNLGNEFNNDLDWIHTKSYFDLQSQYRKDKWRIELNTPINLHTYQIEDTPLQENQDLDQVTFEPRLSIIYDANAFWKFSTSVGLNNQFGTINQLHYAYILQNYRTIQRINAPLPQIFNQTFSGAVSYRNPIKSLFWNVFYTNTKSENNLLYQTQILDNGATELEAIERDNDRNSHNISTRLSKYYSKLDTNVAINADLGLQDFQQILNDETTEIRNQNWGIGVKTETDFTDWFSTEYLARWAFSKNQIQNQSNNTITQQNHLLNLNYYPNENQYLSFKTEYIKNNLFTETTENIFTDVTYRYTWKKKNVDLEVQLSNIFNNENCRTININEFSYVETNFRLRPRQVLFNIRFSL